MSHPVFKNMQNANAYQLFCHEGIMPRISWFLPKSTVIHFTVLSKHYYNLLNDPKSDFGKIFWKKWAVKTKTIKFLKSNTHNYKLKLVKQTISETKKKLKEQRFNVYRFIPLCKKCNKYGKPDIENPYFYRGNRMKYCNCKIVDCQTIRCAMKNSFNTQRNDLNFIKEDLIKQLKKIEIKHQEINKKEKEFAKIPKFNLMLPILKNLKKNARYKINREQAERAYKEVLNLSKSEFRKRRNLNHIPEKRKNNKNKK